MKDKQVESLLDLEEERQRRGLELIASENYVSRDVSTASGSCPTNKYAEGYPWHRYYGGCEIIDQIEQLAIDRLCKLYGCGYANVQPHAGSQANRAVIEAVCNPGDTILSLSLNDGGHLTHGSPVSFSGKYYHIVSYGLKDDETIDYDDLLKKAQIYKPKLIIAGASAYSREWDYEKLVKAKELSVLAQSVSALDIVALNASCVLMFDMAHTAGLIAAGLLKNPCDYCDIVTSTTHKTLRGPRGGIILMKKDFIYDGKQMSKRLNSSVFPGNQGGPLENIISAKAVCFYEALQPEFKEYQKQVIRNAKNLSRKLESLGFKIVTGGTDNHCFLVDLQKNYPELTGKTVEIELGKVDITVNKNMVPHDTRTPAAASGIRLGTPAITSRGITDMYRIAEWISTTIQNLDSYRLGKVSEQEYNETVEKIKHEVNEFALQYKLRADE